MEVVVVRRCLDDFDEDEDSSFVGLEEPLLDCLSHSTDKSSSRRSLLSLQAFERIVTFR